MYKFVRGLMTSRPSSVKGVEIFGFCLVLHTRGARGENEHLALRTNDSLYTWVCFLGCYPANQAVFSRSSHPKPKGM